MTNEVRPIDANRLLTALVAHRAYYCDDTYNDGIAFSIITDVIQTIKEDTPTLNYEPVRYGHWVDSTVLVPNMWQYLDSEKVVSHREKCRRCSYCHQTTKENDPPYCPHCGAKMLKESSK